MSSGQQPLRLVKSDVLRLHCSVRDLTIWKQSTKRAEKFIISFIVYIHKFSSFDAFSNTHIKGCLRQLLQRWLLFVASPFTFCNSFGGEKPGRRNDHFIDTKHNSCTNEARVRSTRKTWSAQQPQPHQFISEMSIWNQTCKAKSQSAKLRLKGNEHKMEEIK